MSKVTTMNIPGRQAPLQTLIEAQEVADEKGIRSLAVVYETPAGEVNALYSSQCISDLALKARFLQITVDKCFLEAPVPEQGEDDGGEAG